jgi:hypothetical protein
MFKKKVSMVIAVIILCAANTAFSDCTVAHTHIGINPTWRPLGWSNPGNGAVDVDPTDDDKLWFFSLPPVHACATPGWPNWEQSNSDTFLVLTPLMESEEHITKPGDPNKVLYTCNFIYSKDGGYCDPNGLQHLDGWHSAFGPQGAWNLESTNAETEPSWDIYLRRERVSLNLDEDDFFTLLPDDTPALERDGDTYALEKNWLSDENSWGIHAHMGFYFWLDEDDEEAYIVLSAHDAGGMYRRSADYTISFAKTVYQPVTGDLNSDGLVDLHDLEILIEHWGESGIYRGGDAEHHEHDHSEDH